MLKRFIMIMALGLLIAAKPQSLNLKTMEDQMVHLDELTENLTVLNFWAVWCKPCVQEVPELNRIHKEFSGHGVKFLAVSISKEKKLVENFLKKNQIGFDVVIDESDDLANFFKISAMPTTLVIDRKHNILFKYRGFSKNEISNLENFLKQQIN